MTKMNGYKVSQEFNSKYLCRACLKTSKDVAPMSTCERNVYLTICPQARKMDHDFNICIICRWMLNRLIKFSNQCQKADEILNQLGNQRSNYEQLTISHNINQTTPVTLYIGPDYDLSDDKNVIIMVEDDHHYDNNVMTVIEDDYHDDDEIPLMMLKQEDDLKGAQIANDVVTSETDIMSSKELKQQVLKHSNKKPKRKKKLPEGFSSRMVQETEEYIVIKLTKEQVMQEISDRGNSDAFTRSPFKCKLCAKGFNFEEVLATHMLKHSLERGSYKCEICSQYCPSAVSLRGHIKSHTTRYKCKVCGQVRLSRQHLLEHHANSHTSAPAVYSCDMCDFKTDKRTVIQRHVRYHKSREKHACHRCGKLYNTVESLRVHTARHNVDSLFRCEQCDKQFITPSSLHTHVQAVHEREEYYCVECDVKFKSRENLTTHFKRARRHRNPSSYKYECPQCNMRFLSQSSLGSHLTCVHGAPKVHSCHICGKRYGTRATLRGHHYRAHNRGLQCPLCHKMFNRTSLLKVHSKECDAAIEHTQKGVPND